MQFNYFQKSCNPVAIFIDFSKIYFVTELFGHLYFCIPQTIDLFTYKVATPPLSSGRTGEHSFESNGNIDLWSSMLSPSHIFLWGRRVYGRSLRSPKTRGEPITPGLPSGPSLQPDYGDPSDQAAQDQYATYRKYEGSRR